MNNAAGLAVLVIGFPSLCIAVAAGICTGRAQVFFKAFTVSAVLITGAIFCWLVFV